MRIATIGAWVVVSFESPLSTEVFVGFVGVRVRVCFTLWWFFFLPPCSTSSFEGEREDGPIVWLGSGEVTKEADGVMEGVLVVEEVGVEVTVVVGEVEGEVEGTGGQPTVWNSNEPMSAAEPQNLYR